MEKQKINSDHKLGKHGGRSLPNLSTQAASVTLSLVLDPAVFLGGPSLILLLLPYYLVRVWRVSYKAGVA